MIVILDLELNNAIIQHIELVEHGSIDEIVLGLEQVFVGGSRPAVRTAHAHYDLHVVAKVEEFVYEGALVLIERIRAVYDVDVLERLAIAHQRQTLRVHVHADLEEAEAEHERDDHERRDKVVRPLDQEHDVRATAQVVRVA